MRDLLSRLLTLFVGICCLAFVEYEPLKDKTFNETYGETYIDEYYLKYGIFEGAVGYNSDWLIKNMISNSYKILNVINARYPNIPKNDCRTLDILEIYTVDDHVLNDRNRFNKYSYVGEIWALFDYRPEEQRKTSIILTYHHYYNSSLLKHELAHYWFYRLCMDYSTKVDPEEFSIGMESL